MSETFVLKIPSSAKAQLPKADDVFHCHEETHIWASLEYVETFARCECGLMRATRLDSEHFQFDLDS